MRNLLRIIFCALVCVFFSPVTAFSVAPPGGDQHITSPGDEAQIVVKTVGESTFVDIPAEWDYCIISFGYKNLLGDWQDAVEYSQIAYGGELTLLDNDELNGPRKADVAIWFDCVSKAYIIQVRRK